MAETPLEKLVEEILAAVLSRGKAKIASFYEKGKNKKALKEAVRAFLDDFRKKNLPYLPLYEEFDFGGFRDFLLSRLDLLEGYFYAKADEREAILKALRDEALVCAKPRGAGGTQVVLKCLNAVLATMDSILMEQLDTEDLMLAYRIEEQYRQNSKALTRELEEHIYGFIHYKGSFAELVDSVNTELPDDGRAYHYKNSRIGFYGREKELRYLDAFLENNAQFLYTVITGPGGIGKSKLLYHYVQSKRNDESWKMLFPSRDIVKELCNHHREFFYPKNLLIVVDYAGQYPEKIGNWMGKILGTRGNSQKIRLVLLERPNPEQNTKPEWYKKMVERRKELENYLWNKQFHEIGLMDRDSLMALMDNIAEQAHKTLTDQNRQDIYERVCSFRIKEKNETSSPTNEAEIRSSHEKKEGGSPLYTILTTDAFLNKIPLSSLDTNKLMEYVLNRDEEYWKTTICGGDEEDLYPCFKEMLVYATATGGWDFTSLGEPLTKESERLRRISRQGKSAVWEKFSQIVTENPMGNPVLNPLEPDLIGEYFVLNFLRDQAADERYQERIRLFWEKLWDYAYFLRRCVDSYLFRQEFRELLDENKSVFWYRERNELVAYLRALLLGNLTAKQDAIAGAKSVEQLRKLSQEEYAGNEEIALLYAAGLFNLSNAQDLAGCKASVGRLGELSYQYAENEAIAIWYAAGLFNLSHVQDLAGCKASVGHLGELSCQYAENKAIALLYAQGLFNLSNAQDLAGCEASVKRLGELSGQYADNEEIALVYAQGLFNLILVQDLADRKVSVEHLGELSAQHVDNEEIALEYAKVLCNLILVQNLASRKASVARLEILSHQYAGNEEIALAYAYGLFNLSNEQDLSVCEVSVERLGELSGRYADNEEIALVYAEGLFNLSNVQDLSGRKTSVERLRELSGQYAGNEEITLEYAKGLFNLSNEQDLSGRKTSVERLGELSGRYADNEEIALEYAEGLLNLSIEQDLAGCKTSVERLGELSGQYVENEEIAMVYAEGLVNLTADQDSIAGAVSVKQLRELSQVTYVGNGKMALEYARGLYNLSHVQDLAGCKASVERLRELSDQYAENEEIALEYAKGLVNLIVKQNSTAGTESVERLRKLLEEHSGNEEIALVYAVFLTWLCAEERSEEIVIQECREFYANWQANPEAVRQVVSAEPDGNMKTLKLFLLEHTELFPEFMEWLVS